MTEAQVGFLFKAASSFARTENNQYSNFLKSYYLMRCKEITKGYGLPEKHFSFKTRCSHCCTEWKKGTEMKVKPVKLSKKQRQRIRALNTNKNNKEAQTRKELLNSNQIEQICCFCKKSTITTVLKPEKVKNKTFKIIKYATEEITKKPSMKKLETNLLKQETKKKPEVNVYNLAKDVFSLKNKNNTIASALKEPPKVIKNSKKKKDKFAGLCQRAVLASVKIKQEKDKQNKLNLFLKPASG